MEANYGAANTPRTGARRLSTETKNAFKTTEFWVYIAFLIAVLIAGTVDNSEGTQFGADDVWLYATIATAAYLISRGLAKSGSRDPYWDRPGANGDGGLGDRVKRAAEVLTEPDQRSDAAAHTQQPTQPLHR
jgi:hypothetical protein